MMNKKITIGILAILLVVVILALSIHKETPIKYLSVEEPITPDADIGMVVTFPGEISEWTLKSIERTYSTLKDAGIRVSNNYYTWGEIEKKEGNYSWGGLDFNIHFITENDMKVSLEIKIIDTVFVGQLPEDVNFTSFDEPAFIGRFKTFILTLLERYEGKIHYLWIGNEIDDYLYKHRDQIEGYIKLYNETYIAVKEKYPEIKVGTISTFHDAKNHQALDIIEMVGRTGDIIGFSLYPQFIEGGDINTFFDEMSSIADRINKKFAITETGWSTSGFGGSEAKQAQYIRDLFQAYKEYKEKIEFLGLFIFYDLPESVNEEIAAHYGLGEYKEFLEFQGSLGLAYNDGTPKESWSVFLEEMKKLEK